MEDFEMTGSFTTNATNFKGALQTGVDPRTGQFFMTFPLLSVAANHQLGPSVDLSLSYSSLSDSDRFGFGKGISLHGVSVYEQGKRISLSNGESWVVNGSGRILHRKLKDCVLAPQGDDMVVHWKSGVTEILKNRGGDLYVTDEIIAPSGRKVIFSWAWNGSQLVLRSVKDEFSTLCRFDSERLALTVWPDSASEQYVVRLHLQNDHLQQLERSLKGATPMRWTIDYGVVGARAVVNKLSHPTGLVDEVKYQDNALKFPSSASISQALPAVSEHRTRYGRDQPATVHEYNYNYVGDNNFLGFGISGRSFDIWSKEHDYLYSQLTDWKESSGYAYGSTQTVLIDGEEKQEIRRRYNNYHLLVSEETRQGSHHVVKELEYHAKVNCDIEGQSAFYHFPKTQTITYKLAGTEQQRLEITEHSFDDYGNPLEIRHPDGTREEYSWYAAHGEAGACPAEPRGFVRFLKSHRITPPVIDGFSVPVQREERRYAMLGNPNCVVQVQSHHYGDATLLSETKIAYVSDSHSAEFGRVSSIVRMLHDLADSTKRHETKQSFETRVEAGRLKQTVTCRSHDLESGNVLETRYKTEKSVYTNLVLQETDAQGVVTRSNYDDLGRIVEQSHADGTPYAAKMTWVYSIERSEDDILGPMTIQTDAQGRSSRTHFDGAGRIVHHDLYDLDISKDWRRVAERKYDRLGRIKGEKHKDWTQQDRKNNATSASIEVETTYAYDQWGQQCKQTCVDGAVNYIETDLVALKQTSYRTNGDGSLRTGKVVTTLDKRIKKPVSVEIYTVDGKPDSKQTHKWDGLGRMRESTDASGNSTQWSYDLYDRVHEQILPDGSKVTKTYAGHLTGKQVIALHVHAAPAASATGTGSGNSYLAGTQKFDSLGRLTETASGGRKTLLAYEHAHSPLSERVTLPSGGNLQYSYIAELGNAKRSVTGQRTASGPHIAQRYQYDAGTRQLIEAIEGNYHIGFGYTPAGAIQTETFVDAVGSGSADQASEAPVATDSASAPVSTYDWTFGGLAESHSDVCRAKRNYTRDKLGRVTKIEDRALKVTLTYDGLGRAKTRTVTTKESAPRTLTTTISYDEFSRETMRTLSDGTGTDVVSLSQNWHKTGLLATRKMQHGAVILTDECFLYDKRNRLTDYRVRGLRPPAAPYGSLSLAHQTYEYDVLNNLTKVVTTHSDKSVDMMIFHYSKTDPTQLITVHHSHKDYPKQVDLKYDTDGRMIFDEAGRSLAYDVAGRLASVKDRDGGSGTYEYDALNRLVKQTRNDGESWSLYYLGDELVNEVAVKDGERRFIKTGHTYLAIEHQQKKQSQGSQAVTLIGANQNNSPVWSDVMGRGSQSHAWSPYGHCNTTGLSIGFNGERVDPVSRTYHLGNGYRAYNPALMRFNAPDNLSPFGPGGINSYAYCSGDPINHADPSGHMSISAGVGIGVGILGILGGAFALLTGGASIGVAGAIAAAIGLAADGTGIASAATEESDPQASATLGWVSLGLGIASGVVGAGAAAASRRAVGILTDQKRSNIINEIKAMRRPSLVERLESQATVDMAEIKKFAHYEDDARNILLKMNDLYTPENIIGYTKSKEDLPTVYYKSGSLRGRITLEHPKETGKALPRKNVFFRNSYRKGFWGLHENYYFGNAILSHSSRGPFTPINKSSESFFIELVHHTENSFPIKESDIARAISNEYSIGDIA